MNDSVPMTAQPLTAEEFARFGDVIDCAGRADMIINQGRCQRFHDQASLEAIGDEARLGISLFQSELVASPVVCAMVERHPHGTQAFLPMSFDPFLVIVADDDSGRPGQIHAFLTSKGQGVNYHRNIWHGVLTPLSGPGLFAVVDRVGGGHNLEEYWFEQPRVILIPSS